MKRRMIFSRKHLLVAAFLAGVAVGAITTSAVLKLVGNQSHQVAKPATCSSLAALLSLGPDQLGSVDIARANLLCADGLAGGKEIDLSSADRLLDDWAARVAAETDRHFHKFRQNPGNYENSEAYFRILVLVTVLQQDLGIRYNPERISAPDFSDPNDLFLTGLLGEKRSGTCGSMPVLYVAVGRRLGYPLKLVTAKAHLFARWESADGKQRLNIEATNQGLNCFPDEYYRTWPVAMSPDEIGSGQFLRSLTPAEELAVFLSTRGHCLEQQGRLPEAQLAHAQAHALAPKSPVHLAFLVAAVRREMPDWHRVQVDLGQNQGRPASRSLEQ